MEKITATRIAEAGKICGTISSFQFCNKDNHSANDALIRTLLQHLS
jgi:hypothetical protein